MRNRPFTKLLSLYLVFALPLLAIPAQGWAMFIPAGQASSDRQADLGSIQKTLESTVVKQRLLDLGLSSEEAMARISALSDEQTHTLAANLDSVQAGADGLGTLVFLLVAAIVVVIVLEATGHHVIFR
ncbi:MAG: PA2779 family protein [Nitrospirota bacterium]